MDSKDRTSQDDIIELIDIIEEGEENASPSGAPKKTPEDLDDFEDLFLFPGASEDSRSLLDEMDDNEETDDDFPELDAIFEDLESTPEPAQERPHEPEKSLGHTEPSPLESRIATLEERISSLPDADGIRSEFDLARQSMLQETGIEGVRSRIAELEEQTPGREEIVQIAETAVSEALAARLEQEETDSGMSAESVRELVSVSVREAMEPLEALLKEQAGELARVHQKIEAVQDSVLTQETVASMIEQAVQEAGTDRDKRISELESELAAMRDILNAQVDTAAGTPDMAALLKEMDMRIEKAVPTAAARIIREEIAALLKG